MRTQHARANIIGTANTVVETKSERKQLIMKQREIQDELRIYKSHPNIHTM